MKRDDIPIAPIIIAVVLTVLLILVAFVWFPEREAAPEQQGEKSIPAESVEKQVRQDPRYTCETVNDITTCTRADITFELKDGKAKLYISFDGHATTVDCSVYLPRHRDIHKTISEVEGRTREDHLRASCVSL